MLPSAGTTRIFRLGLIGAALLCAATPGHAGTITYVTTNFDLGAGWRTASDPKYDIDGNNVLGTDGWFVAGANGSTQLPFYLTSLTTDPNVFGGNPSYAMIDNPATTPGASPTTIRSGTLNPFPGSGVQNVDVRFTVGPDVPAAVAVGVMIDNLDLDGYNPSSVQLVQEGGGGSSSIIDTTGATYHDRNPDWLMFMISGAQSGQTYDVLVGGGVLGSPYDCACLGAVSFDSVPEPSSFMLTGLGAIAGAVFAIRRRRLSS
jgi:hypothetical protein